MIIYIYIIINITKKIYILIYQFIRIYILNVIYSYAKFLAAIIPVFSVT